MDDHPLRQPAADAPDLVRLAPEEWHLQVGAGDYRAFRTVVEYLGRVLGREVSESDALGALVDHARRRIEIRRPIARGASRAAAPPPDFRKPSDAETFRIALTLGLVDLEGVVAAARRRFGSPRSP